MNVALNIKREPGIDIAHDAHDNKKCQVLVNFGLGRKKVFSVDGCTSLADQFKVHVNLDPAFSKLLKSTFLVFQEYNDKFGTWVDVDSDGNLKDGAVVKAVFFPKTIEASDTNPGSIKRKSDDLDDIHESKRPPVFCEVIDVSDSSTECAETENVKPLEKTTINGNLEQRPQNKVNGKQSGKIVEKDSKTGKTIVKKKQPVKKIPPLVSSFPVNEKINGIESMLIGKVANTEKTGTAISNTRNLNDNQHARSVEQHFIKDVKQQTGSALLCDQQTTFAILNTRRKTRLYKKNLIDFKEWGRKHSVKRKLNTRLQWAISNIHSVNFWKNFIFSGISGFYFQDNHVKRVPFSSLTNSHSKEKVQIFWGSVSFKGTIIISTIIRTFTARALCNILEHHIFPFVRTHFPSGVKLQYCHSLHTQYESNQIMKLLEGSFIKLINWPVDMRDTNPLEHVWDLIAEKVKNVDCANSDEMISAIFDVWSKDLDLKLLCYNFVLSLKDVVQDVIEWRGSYSRKFVEW